MARTFARPEAKPCCACRAVKPLAEYHRDSSREDGCQRRCKECTRAYNAARYVVKRDDITAANKQWKAANPERAAEIDRASRERRADKRAVENRAWREANREARTEYERRYRADNPDLRRGWEAQRRARKAQCAVESVHPLVVLERADGVCGICGSDVDPFRFDVDHIVPLSRGGAHSYANTQPAHPSCNYRKGSRCL